MPLDPPLSTAPRAPVTVLVALGAIGVSALWWSGTSIGPLEVTADTMLAQPWRLLTSALPHVDVIHLAFNLYWWWRFAARTETAWGSARLLGVTLLLAATSAAAESAFSGGGVGLSGVGYGLFGLLYFAQRSDPRLAGTVDRNTAFLFAVWFVLCIALTAAGVWRVGNVAHGVGAVVGALLGRCIAAPPEHRPGRIAQFAIVVTLIGAAAVTAPSFRKPSFYDLAERGSDALIAGRPADAVPLLEAAVRADPTHALVKLNLGIAYQQLNRHDDALPLYRHAVEIDPSLRETLAPTIASILGNQAHQAALRQEWGAATEAAEEALRWHDTDDNRVLLDWIRTQDPEATSPMPPADGAGG